MTKSAQKGEIRSLAGFFKEFAEFLQLTFAQMAKHVALEVVLPFVEFGEESQTFFRDTCRDDAAVFRCARTFDEATLLKSVEQACDVGIVSDHSFTDLAAGKSGVSGAAKDAQDVELGRRDVERLQGLGEPTRQEIGSSLQIKEDFLFEAVERLLLLDLVLQATRHVYNDSR